VVQNRLQSQTFPEAQLMDAVARKFKQFAAKSASGKVQLNLNHYNFRENSGNIIAYLDLNAQSNHYPA
jgi:hypothetical protein